MFEKFCVRSLEPVSYLRFPLSFTFFSRRGKKLLASDLFFRFVLLFFLTDEDHKSVHCCSSVVVKWYTFVYCFNYSAKKHLKYSKTFGVFCASYHTCFVRITVFLCQHLKLKKASHVKKIVYEGLIFTEVSPLCSINTTT